MKIRHSRIWSAKLSDVTIAVYGLGKMGLPLAAVFADAGATVLGVDVNAATVASVNRGEATFDEPGLARMLRKVVRSGRLRAYRSPQKADVHVILVPTLVSGTKVDLSPVVACAKSISRVLKKGDVVITESTMPPGSTEGLIPVLERSGLRFNLGFFLGHCPERTMTGTAIRDITGEYPKVIGGSDAMTVEALSWLYSRVNKAGTVPCSSIRAAECVKVFEGVYRDVNIALANELGAWCDRHSLDALEIISVANTQKYCHLHSPGCGVGGHCIPYYPHFIIDEGTPLIRLARNVNESMAPYTVGLASEAVSAAGRKPRDAEVLVLGLTFRAGVREFAHTMAKPIIALARKRFRAVHAFDPLCDADDAKALGARWKEGFSGIDAVIITTDDRSFAKLPWKRIAKQMRTPVVVDGRNVLSPSVMKKLGFEYRGIGRR